MLDTKQKPRVKVFSGASLSREQVTDYQTQWLYSMLARIDNDEVLRKAGKSRADLANLLWDDQIDQAISRRKETLKTTKYTLMPSNSRVAKFVFNQLEEHIDTIITSAIDCKMYGYDVAEMTWDLSGQFNRVNLIKPKPIEWFDIDNQDNVKWFPNSGQQPVVISDQADYVFRYLVQRHEPTFKHPLGKALLSRVYWLWYFKTNGWRFWSKYLERFGSPLVIGKTDTTEQSEMDKFASTLLSAHSSGVIAVSEKDDVQIAGASGSGEAFARYDDTVNKRITVYLLGQTLTSGTDTGGTYGQGQIHQEQQEIIFNSDREQAKIAIQRFIDVICYANNFEPPHFEWITDIGLQPERADRDLVLYQQGLRFTRSYYSDIYDFEDSHFWLVENEPTANAPVTQSPTLSTPDNQALANGAFFMANGNAPTQEFTKEQQGLEDLADSALSENMPVFDSKKILHLAENSKDEADFKVKLIDMVGQDLAESKITQLMLACNMASQVRGWVDEDVGK